MRRILPLILLLAFVGVRVFAQPNTAAFLNSVTQTSETLDFLSFTDPDFKWDMDGKLQVFLNEGINYLKEGSPDVALGQFNKALGKDPQLWVAHYYKGICLKLLRRFDQAFHSFSLANTFHRDDYLITLELGKVCDLLEKKDEGRKYLETSAGLNSRSPLPLYYLGNHLMLEGSNDAARKSYNAALARDPMMLDAEVKLAFLAVAQSKSSDELTSRMVRVLRKDSLHKQALYIHGMLTAMSEPEHSIKNWNTLIRLDPSNLLYRAMRIPINVEFEKYNEAFSDLKKIIERMQANENSFVGDQSAHDKMINIGGAGSYVMMNVYGLNDSDAALVRRAYCLLYVGRYEGALQVLDQTSAGDQSALIVFLKAVTLEHMGSHDKAYVAYSAALKPDNDIIDAHKKRGIYRMEMKQWALAKADFKKMLSLNNNALYAYRGLGLCEYYEEDYKGAIAEFSAYLKLDSINREVFAFRGMAYQKEKQVLPSTLDFIRAGKYDVLEPFPVVRAELEKMLAAKDTAKVIQWLKMSTDAAPGYSDANRYLINLCVKTGKWVEVAPLIDREYPERYFLSAKEESHIASLKGTSLIYREKPGEAITELDRAIKLNENNSLAWLSRGKAYLKLNNRPSAIKDLKKARSLGEKEARIILNSLE